MQAMTVFSGLALKDVIEDNFMAHFVSDSRSDIRRVYEPTAVLYDLIREGERPDVVIGVTSALEDMAHAGHVRQESIRPLVRSEVGVAVAAGDVREPLHSVDDLREMLERAASVAYSATGASGGVFQRVLSDLGLTESVTAKAVVLAKGFTAEAVRDGRAEIAVQQISELAAVAGVNIVGPLPAELGAHVELSIAIGSHAGDPELAHRFSQYLRDAGNAAVYREAFLNPMS